MIANHPFTLTSLHLQIVIAKGECSVRIRQQRNTSEGHLALSLPRPTAYASARIRPSIQSFWPIPLWASAARSECNGDGSRSPFERACGGGLQPFRRRSRWQWWLRAGRRVGPVTDPLHLTFLGEGGRGGIRITGGGRKGGKEQGRATVRGFISIGTRNRKKHMTLPKLLPMPENN